MWPARRSARRRSPRAATTSSAGDAVARPVRAWPSMAAHAGLRAAGMVARDAAFLGRANGQPRLADREKGCSMSDIGPQPDASPAATPKEPERGERAGVPEPSRIESWLRTLTGFENARVVGVEPLTDGLSNVTCRLKVTDGPVTT